MRLTPLDVEQRDFDKRVRGYDREQVREFLVEIARAYEEVLGENLEQRALLAERDQELADLRDEQSDIRRALVAAEKLAENITGAARKEAEATLTAAQRQAELVVDEAGRQGRILVDEAREQEMALRRELDALRQLRARFEARIRAEVEETLAVVGRSQGELPAARNGDGSSNKLTANETPALYPASVVVQPLVG